MAHWHGSSATGSCTAAACTRRRGDQNFELLPEALRAGEMGRAFECAHTLKGMLANMGLIPLYDIVVRIVEPLRAGEPAELLPVCDELLAARDRLNTLLKESA